MLSGAGHAGPHYTIAGPDETSSEVNAAVRVSGGWD